MRERGRAQLKFVVSKEFNITLKELAIDHRRTFLFERVQRSVDYEVKLDIIELSRLVEGFNEDWRDL